jgi:hypothetical protein
MITETIFVTLILFMLVTLILTLYFENAALGGVTIILCLILATILFPSAIGGVSYPIGKFINQTTTNTTLLANETITYGSYSSIPFAMVILVIGFYMSLQIIWFRGQSIEIDEQEKL